MSEIMQRLKQETRQAHDRVEAVSYATEIKNGTISLAQYKSLLPRQYILHYTVENAIETGLTQSEALQITFPKRRKVDLLRKDMEELNILQTEISLPTGYYINSIPEALGAMYVTEGATLGGMFIKRMLSNIEHIRLNTSFHYYGCYGKMVGVYWQEMVRIIESYAKTTENQDTIVKTAKATFELYENILTREINY